MSEKSLEAQAMTVVSGEGEQSHGTENALDAPKRASLILLFAGIALIAAAKLWWVHGLLIQGMTSAFLDDGLYIDLAKNILAGEWLGPYSYTTLVKSPLYSIWIAATSSLRLPLLLSQNIFHILACCALVFGLRHWIKRPSLLLLLFALVVFDPKTYDGQSLRVVREGIYLTLSILFMAGAAGLLSAEGKRGLPMALWTTVLGASFTLSWLTREEGIWLLPSLLLILGYTVYQVWRSSAPGRPSRYALLAIPCVIFALGVGGVSGVNKAYYGIFGIVESKHPSFRAAYGALTRVRHRHWQQFNNVPRETRMRIYKASPAFSELTQSLEVAPGPSWGQASASMLKPPDPTQIAGGKFIWAFRDAVRIAGYHETAPMAMEFYARLAQEINQACDDDVLDCGPARASNIAPWRSEYPMLMAQTLYRGASSLVRLKNMGIHIRPSAGNEEGVRIFEDITHGELSRRSLDDWGMSTEELTNHFGLGKLRAAIRGYSVVFRFVAPLALFLWLTLATVEYREKRMSPLFIFNVAIFGGILARLVILSYLAITSFPALNNLYKAPLFPMMYTFSFMAILAFAQLFEPSRNAPRPSDGP